MLWYDSILCEVLEEKVKKRTGRRNPRCVKRRLKPYPAPSSNSLRLPKVKGIILLK
jgi:hypothetical protein